MPELIYTLEDDDAIVPTSYELRVTYNAYEGTFGRSYEDQPHVADISIAEVLAVHVGDDKFAPIGKQILETIRAKYDGCTEIEAACWEHAFGRGAPDPAYQRAAARGMVVNGRDVS